MAVTGSRDLDLERLTVNIRQGKGKRDRVIPIGDRAAAWVRKYLSLENRRSTRRRGSKKTRGCHTERYGIRDDRIRGATHGGFSAAATMIYADCLKSETDTWMTTQLSLGRPQGIGVKAVYRASIV